MAASGVKTVAFIGFSDAYGEGWYQEFSKAAALKNLQIVANERYNRTDTSVTGQALKMVSAKPDAVLIAGSGTPAALPQKTLKEQGLRKQSSIRPTGWRTLTSCVWGARMWRALFLPAGPVLVAMQLPATHPVRKSASAYVTAYEAAYGKGSVSTLAPMAGTLAY